jgi:heterodisulfide reductase subunit D
VEERAMSGELDSAINETLSELNPVTLHYFESCVSCGLCTPHCPYIAAGPEYEPVNKAEELRRIWRKRVTAVGYALGSIVNAGYPKGEDDLKRMTYMAYRCVNCGNCLNTCPFGIYSGELIRILRGFLSSMGRAPTILKRLSEIESGDIAGHEGVMDLWNSTIGRVRGGIGKELPLDREGAEVLYLPTVIEAILTPETIISTSKILDALGINWTLPSRPLGFEFGTGSFIGDRKSERKSLERVNSYVKGIGAKKVILSHGGTTYEEMRFQMPFSIREKVDYEILHVAEYLYELYRAGKFRIEAGEVKVAWHDPCKLRNSGVKREPREILRASSKEYRELPKSQGVFSRCCGGGSGIALLSEDLRELRGLLGLSREVDGWEAEFTRDLMRDYEVVMREKAREVVQSGAEVVVTGCPTCIFSLNKGSELTGSAFRAVHISHYLLDKIKL